MNVGEGGAFGVGVSDALGASVAADHVQPNSRVASIKPKKERKAQVLEKKFFRAESVSHALRYIGGIFDASLFGSLEHYSGLLFFLILVFLVIEWFGRESEYAIERIGFRAPKMVRWSFYMVLTLMIVAYMDNQQDFIYFQF